MLFRPNKSSILARKRELTRFCNFGLNLPLLIQVLEKYNTELRKDNSEWMCRRFTICLVASLLRLTGCTLFLLTSGHPSFIFLIAFFVNFLVSVVDWILSLRESHSSFATCKKTEKFSNNLGITFYYHTVTNTLMSFSDTIIMKCNCHILYLILEMRFKFGSILLENFIPQFPTNRRSNLKEEQWMSIFILFRDVISNE